MLTVTMTCVLEVDGEQTVWRRQQSQPGGVPRVGDRVRVGDLGEVEVVTVEWQQDLLAVRVDLAALRVRQSETSRVPVADWRLDGWDRHR